MSHGGSSAVSIVGAGLAGLACAVHLHERGVPVRVFEASDGVGGRVRTDEIDGVLVDRGFQVLLTAYPELHRQFDVAALELRAFDPGALVRLGAREHVVSDPFRDSRHMISTALAPIGTVFDKLRVVRLRHHLRKVHAGRLVTGAPGLDDVTTMSALRDLGFSTTMIDRFFRPLVGGIQLDPELATSRRMFDVILRMLSDGDAAVPARGMGAIPAQLAARLPAGTIELGAPVTGVAPGELVVAGTRHTSDAIVIAAEGPAAADLLRLPAVASKPVGSVWFVADEAPTDSKHVVLDGDGRGPALNVAVMSNVSPSYAPGGGHVVATAAPGRLDDDLSGLVRAQLRRWWGGQVDRWTELRTFRIRHGQPAQPPPLSPRRPVALGDGLFVCGDHRDTASIQGALYSGRRCAAAVLAAHHPELSAGNDGNRASKQTGREEPGQALTT